MDYPLLNLFLTMLYFFLWIAWIFILFRCILDVFRDDELGGGGKALWSIFIILVPWLGVLVYLIARGGGMAKRDVQQATRQRDEMAEWIKTSPNANAGVSAADEITKLAELNKSGVLTDQEFAAQKAKLLA